MFNAPRPQAGAETDVQAKDNANENNNINTNAFGSTRPLLLS